VSRGLFSHPSCDRTGVTGDFGRLAYSSAAI
jgi:hypothetical protein